MKKMSAKSSNINKKAISDTRYYTYNTKVGVIAKKCNITLDVSPNTKLGDFFKMKGQVSLAKLLDR